MILLAKYSLAKGIYPKYKSVSGSSCQLQEIQGREELVKLNNEYAFHKIQSVGTSTHQMAWFLQ